MDRSSFARGEGARHRTVVRGFIHRTDVARRIENLDHRDVLASSQQGFVDSLNPVGAQLRGNLLRASERGGVGTAQQHMMEGFDDDDRSDGERDGDQSGGGECQSHPDRTDHPKSRR